MMKKGLGSPPADSALQSNRGVMGGKESRSSFFCSRKQKIRPPKQESAKRAYVPLGELRAPPGSPNKQGPDEDLICCQQGYSEGRGQVERPLSTKRSYCEMQCGGFSPNKPKWGVEGGKFCQLLYWMREVKKEERGGKNKRGKSCGGPDREKGGQKNKGR